MVFILYFCEQPAMSLYLDKFLWHREQMSDEEIMALTRHFFFPSIAVAGSLHFSVWKQTDYIMLLIIVQYKLKGQWARTASKAARSVLAAQK